VVHAARADGVLERARDVVLTNDLFKTGWSIASR